MMGLMTKNGGIHSKAAISVTDKNDPHNRGNGMSEWQPIEEYDKRKRKPKDCVFWVSESNNGRYTLSACMSIERYKGSREITHFNAVGRPTDEG